MADTSERCSMACEVLQKTKDGNDLAPDHLWLLQEWVNDRLNELGEKKFREIHARVMAGNYTKPWLCGVENLTRDHEGYVYWKGIHVEHYSHDNYEEIRKDAIELARRCQILEARGIQPSCGRVVWRWADYEPGAPHLGNAHNLPKELQKPEASKS